METLGKASPPFYRERRDTHSVFGGSLRGMRRSEGEREKSKREGERGVRQGKSRTREQKRASRKERLLGTLLRRRDEATVGGRRRRRLLVLERERVHSSEVVNRSRSRFLVEPLRSDVVSETVRFGTTAKSAKNFIPETRGDGRTVSRIGEDDDDVLALDAARNLAPFVALEPLDGGGDARARRTADEQTLGADQALAHRERFGVARLDPVVDVGVGEHGRDLRVRCGSVRYGISRG